MDRTLCSTCEFWSDEAKPFGESCFLEQKPTARPANSPACGKYIKRIVIGIDELRKESQD